MRALIIDDSREFRRFLRPVMNDLGFEVYEADDGADALDKLKRLSAPEIALVDWTMAGMDGIEFIRLVRAEREFDGMRLMMVTAKNDTERVQEALAAGADEFLMKPFGKDAVREKLRILGLHVA